MPPNHILSFWSPEAHICELSRSHALSFIVCFDPFKVNLRYRCGSVSLMSEKKNEDMKICRSQLKLSLWERKNSMNLMDLVFFFPPSNNHQKINSLGESLFSPLFCVYLYVYQNGLLPLWGRIKTHILSAEGFWCHMLIFSLHTDLMQFAPFLPTMIRRSITCLWEHRQSICCLADNRINWTGLDFTIL